MKSKPWHSPTVNENRSERSCIRATCFQLNFLKMLENTSISRHWQYDILVNVGYSVLSLKIPCKDIDRNYQFRTINY